MIISMIILQLIVFPLFLKGSFAHKLSTCRNNKDCITTFSLNEQNCTLNRISSNAIDFASLPKYKKLFDSLNSEFVDTPQCYLSMKDQSGQTKPGYLFISCHCTKKFYTGCINTRSMAEAIYQWRKDPDSLVEKTKEMDSKFMGKVDCILKGFEKYQLTFDIKMKTRKTEEYHWKINCEQNTIQKTQFPKMYIDPLPKNASIAMDVDCDSKHPKELFPRVYCSDDLCYEKSVDIFESSSIALKLYTLIRKSIDKGKVVKPVGNCKNDKSRNMICLLGGFRQLVDNLMIKNGNNVSTSPMTSKKMKENRIPIKMNQNLDDGSSSIYILSWFIMCLYFIPFISTIFIVFSSFGKVKRSELGPFVTSTIKDVEDVIEVDLRKTASNVSLKKSSKQKSEMIDLAIVTTTSQMGNLTDLGSEGPTGPPGAPSSADNPLGAAPSAENGPGAAPSADNGPGSLKTVSRDALKSGEDTKDSTIDGGL